MTKTALLSHRGLVYDERDDVVERLVPEIADALDRGEAVLLSLDEDFLGRFEAALGPRADDVTFLRSDARYARPVDAMAALWRFVRAAIVDGAPRIHSIGELPVVEGTLSDEWQWYESACNEVLADLPLVATCLYDGRKLDPATVTVVARTHPEFHAASGTQRPAAFGAEPPAMPVAPTLPPRAAEVSLSTVTDPRTARRAVSSLPLVADVGERAALVVSELVTNAIRHGSGAADLDVWAEGGGVTIRVRDEGPGLADPFATIRPVREAAESGAGLWVCNIESDGFALRSDGAATQAIASIRPRR